MMKLIVIFIYSTYFIFYTYYIYHYALYESYIYHRTLRIFFIFLIKKLWRIIRWRHKHRLPAVNFSRFYFHPRQRLSIHVVTLSRTRTGIDTMIPQVITESIEKSVEKRKRIIIQPWNGLLSAVKLNKCALSREFSSIQI